MKDNSIKFKGQFPVMVINGKWLVDIVFIFIVLCRGGGGCSWKLRVVIYAVKRNL